MTPLLTIVGDLTDVERVGSWEIGEGGGYVLLIGGLCLIHMRWWNNDHWSLDFHKTANKIDKNLRIYIYSGTCKTLHTSNSETKKNGTASIDSSTY